MWRCISLCNARVKILNIYHRYIMVTNGGFTRSQKFATLQKLHIFATFSNNIKMSLIKRSWPYVFIFRLSFRLTVKIYPFTVLLFYMSTDVPVQFASSSFISSTRVPTHRSTRKYIYLHAFLSSNHKDLPVTTTTCVHAPRCTRSWPYLFLFILSFRLTV